MQQHGTSQNRSFQTDQRNIIISALIIIAIVSAASFIVGFDLLVGIAWAFAIISAIMLMGTALWMIRHPGSYPMSASLPQRAKVQLIGSICLSICVLLLDRTNNFSLYPALFGLLQAVLLAITTIQILALSSANLHIIETESKVQEKCQVLRTIQLNLERVAGYTKGSDLADEIRKLAEVVRFSDPVSGIVLADIEEKLQKAVSELEQAVLQENSTQVQILLKKTSLLLDERNQKCLAAK